MSIEIKELTEEDVWKAVKAYYRFPKDAWIEFECKSCHGGACVERISILAPEPPEAE